MDDLPSHEVAQFDWTDYTGFLLMLLSSALIGIYFGCFGKKRNTTEEYLHGAKNMSIWPVALSLIATNIAAVLIYVPSEVYTHNALYILISPSLLLSCIIMSYVFLPVFFNLEINNSYEYLELRFSKTTKAVASVIYILSSLLYLPFTVYVPALAVSQVTGMNLYYISVGVTGVCIFYTAIGGLKAFVWSDFFQTVVLVIVTFTILMVGTMDAGGFQKVFQVSSKGRMLDVFDLNPNPFVRNTFWTMVIGSILDTFVALVAQQDSIQRFKSLPTIQDANKVLFIFWVGITGIMAMSVYAGVLAYATYFSCDPMERGMVQEADQIFPFYVMDKIGHITAFPGLFVAAVLSGGLSSLAAVLNTLAGSIYEDYLKREDSSERRANICMKSIVVLMGIYAVAAVPVVERMGTVLAVLYSVDGITAAPCLSFFVLGMLTPWCNSAGAIAGACSSMLFLTWVAVGSVIAEVNVPNQPIYPGVPNTCNITVDAATLNFTLVDEALQQEEEGTFFLYNLSFMYYTTFGTLLNVVVALVVSYFTGMTDLSTLDPSLISPPLRRFLPTKEEYQQPLTDLKKVEANKEEIEKQCNSQLQTELTKLDSEKEYNKK